MQTTPTMPESEPSRPIDPRAVKRGDYRLATVGVTTAELLRMLKAVRLCANSSLSMARLVSISQGKSGFSVSSFAGPISMATVAPCAVPGDTFLLTAERGTLIRAARRLDPVSRPLLSYGRRVFALSDGVARSQIVPHLPPSTLPLDPAPFASPTASLALKSAPDLGDMTALVNRAPKSCLDRTRVADLSRTPLFLPGTRVELTPAEARFAGPGFAFHVAHAPFSLPDRCYSYAFTRQVPVLLVIAIARAFVASGGQVSVSALLRDELFLRYSFGNTALTVQVTGQVEGDPADVDCIDETEDAE